MGMEVAQREFNILPIPVNDFISFDADEVIVFHYILLFYYWANQYFPQAEF